MHSFDITENEAFDKLRTLARRHHLKLHAVVDVVLEDPIAAHRLWQ